MFFLVASTSVQSIEDSFQANPKPQTLIFMVLVIILVALFGLCFLTSCYLIYTNSKNQVLKQLMFTITCISGIGFGVFGIVISTTQTSTATTKIQTITTQLNALLKTVQQYDVNINNLNYLQSNTQIVQNCCSQFVSLILQAVGAHQNFVQHFHVIDQNVQVSQIQNNLITNSNLSALQSNYPIIMTDIRAILNHIGTINGNNSYDFSNYSTVLQQAANSKTSLITATQQLNPSATSLNDVNQLITNLSTNIKTLSSQLPVRNLTLLFQFFDGLFASLLSTQNQILLGLVAEYKANVCSEVGSIADLNTILTSMVALIGPTTNYGFYSDNPPSKFANMAAFQIYVKNFATTSAYLDSQISLIQNSLGLFILPYANGGMAFNQLSTDINTFFTQALQTLSQDHNLSNIGNSSLCQTVNMIATKIISDYSTIKSTILDLWSPVNITTLSNIISVMTLMSATVNAINANLGPPVAHATITPFLDCVNFISSAIAKISTLATTQVTLGLVPVTNIDYSNFNILFNNVQMAFIPFVNTMNTIDNTVNDLFSAVTCYTNIINKLINMQPVDNILITHDKTNISNYIINMRTAVCNLYFQLYHEMTTTLINQAADFGGHSSWYNSSVLQGLSAYYDSTSIGLNNFTVPLAFISTTDQTDVTSIQSTITDTNINIMTRNFPDGSIQIIPTVTLQYLLDSMATQMLTIYNTLSGINNQLQNNKIITIYLNSQINTLFNNFLYACTTIPALRLSNYLLLFGKNNSNIPIGVGKTPLENNSDISFMLLNLPSQLLDPNGSTITL